MSGYDLTHASFFSGVGGLDLGLERAGWRTVSFSEIDPYARAVLAERWPGVPNLGDITALASTSGPKGWGHAGVERSHAYSPITGRWSELRNGFGWQHATLWSGGFPCQDLSVAGKRAGFAGARSSLAFAFLDLVEQHRPPLILLENVPGLLSSHRGRDMAALLGRLAELGYGVGYRILDARHFGVPQRRRRVFIVAITPGGRAGAERAAEVLSVGSRCHRHPAAGVEAGEGAARGAGERVAPSVRSGGHGDPGIGRDNDEDRLVLPQSINAKWAKGYSGPAGDEHHNLTLSSPSPDPGGVRAPDGLAGRVHDRPVVYTKARRAQTSEDDETWVGGEVMPTLNSFDVGDVRTTAAIIGYGPQDDPLLPLGLDSHRYRCCGNGVVSSVAEWVGLRLAALA